MINYHTKTYCMTRGSHLPVQFQGKYTKVDSSKYLIIFFGYFFSFKSAFHLCRQITVILYYSSPSLQQEQPVHHIQIGDLF